MKTFKFQVGMFWLVEISAETLQQAYQDVCSMYQGFEVSAVA